MAHEPQLRNGSPIRQLLGVQVVATGSYVPEQVVTNEDLAALGYDADWILQRTGIRQRRHAPDGISTGDMALSAARACLQRAEVDPGDIDLLLLATYSPDHLLPATANFVQNELGLNCAAMDVTAACAGFLYALVTGAQYVANGCSALALVVGSDTNSRMMDPQDQKTYPLFGDGAGALLLRRGNEDQGLTAFTLGADGSGERLLYRPVGGSRAPATAECIASGRHFVQMDGRPVFKWAVRLLERTLTDVLRAASLELSDVDVWVLHQANLRIIDAAVQSLGIDRDRVVLHLDRYGNTSAGSVPLALDESCQSGRIRRGSRVVMCGFGAGLTWGTAVWRW